jgi:hypothetical protein
MRFETDIKPLFRESDQRSMQAWFDLWSYDDVLDHAQDILERVEDGEMPCDEPWEEEKVQVSTITEFPTLKITIFPTPVV